MAPASTSPRPLPDPDDDSFSQPGAAREPMLRPDDLSELAEEGNMQRALLESPRTMKNADEGTSQWAFKLPSLSISLTALVLLGLMAFCLVALKQGRAAPGEQYRELAIPAWSPTAMYTIENVNAGGQYLNVVDNATSAGAVVQLWGNPDFQSAKWRITQGPTGTYTIGNVNAVGMFLNIVDEGTQNGAQVQVWNNPESEATQWRVVQTTVGTYTIESVHAAGRYLNVVDNERRSGARIQIWDNPECLSSQWHIFKLPDDSGFTAEEGDDSSSWSVWEAARRELNIVRTWDGWEALPFAHGSSTTTTTTTTTTTETTTSTGTSTTTTTSTVPPSTSTLSHTATRHTSRTKTSATSTSATTTAPQCVVPSDDDDCYQEVVGAMYDLQGKGIDGEGSVNMWSSFEEVQDHLHKTNKGSTCSASCECETARIGSPCYEKVLYARKHGIKEHPEWYPDLGEDAPFEDFQTHLWKEDPDSNCTKPCRVSWNADTSVFCFSVARKDAYEADVMRAQLEAGAGIFSCDGFAVASETAWTVGKGPGGRIGTVKTLLFVGAEVGMSKDGTAANTLLFINAWNAVVEQTFVLDYDWTLKVDPDAVVLADRLRNHLGPKSGQNVFIRNCNKVPESPDFPMMFGSLEALSKEAMRTYAVGYTRCKNELDWYSWGEDFFLGKCLPHLNVQPADDFDLISDGVCTGVDCNSGSSAAFHPFKSSGDWMGCWGTATSQWGAPKPALP